MTNARSGRRPGLRSFRSGPLHLAPRALVTAGGGAHGRGASVWPLARDTPLRLRSEIVVTRACTWCNSGAWNRRPCKTIITSTGPCSTAGWDQKTAPKVARRRKIFTASTSPAFPAPPGPSSGRSTVRAAIPPTRPRRAATAAVGVVRSERCSGSDQTVMGHGDGAGRWPRCCTCAHKPSNPRRRSAGATATKIRVAGVSASMTLPRLGPTPPPIPVPRLHAAAP